MADHGVHDIVERGKPLRVKWPDDRGKNGMRPRLVAQQFNSAKRDDVTQNTVRLLVSKASSFGHKVGPEARCHGIAVSPPTTRRLTRTSSSFRRKVCAPSYRCDSFDGHERHEEGELGSR